ncbi:MAG: hypothetical protein RLZZ385_1189 [Pseudomonadota bacterium]|jgi:lysyl-tRNA synthetase class 2
MADWRPSTSLDNLRARAVLLDGIRGFFRQRDVLEVDTPLLATTSATDPHLQSLEVPGVFPGDRRPHYLQTSPEFAMKRLLAAGSGDIFQLGKAFRQDERSRRHHPEFTLLEWYRIGFDDQQLMDEVAELVQTLTGCQAPARHSYRDIFLHHLDLDPHLADTAQLRAALTARVAVDARDFSRDDVLQLLLAQVIEPQLIAPCFIHDFPASMAALARVENDAHGVAVGRRFELFMAGMEIANGYYELTDTREQRRRFEQDNAQRRRLGRPQLPVDEALLAALQHGLPACAGVALGVDRLLMVQLGITDIRAAIPFTLERSADS